GLRLTGSATTGNLVQGNFIGTDATGTQPLGNAADGVRVVDTGPAVSASPRNTIAGNVISANTAGVEVQGNAGGTTILANRIGTDAAGQAPLGNTFGVFLNDALGNTVGGTTPDARNVIAGNR